MARMSGSWKRSSDSWSSLSASRPSPSGRQAPTSSFRFRSGGLVVGAATDGIRVGEIAGRIGSAVPTTSRLVRRLERRGLVAAERDEADRRATLVRLTPTGDGFEAPSSIADANSSGKPWRCSLIVCRATCA